MFFRKKSFFLSRAINAVFLCVALCFISAIFWPGISMSQNRTHTVYFEGSDHELSVFRIYGKKSGKTLMIVGGIQGDEPGGHLSADLYADFSLSKGNLIVVPRANFLSIVLKQRQINEDMNRKFAESGRANYESKIVDILKKLIAESDCFLNLHDGSGFFSEKWESPEKNPKRYGQSIIADTDVYKNKKTGQTVALGEMARSVARHINDRIENPDYHFKFNNHKTKLTSSIHKEQRKSATYYALYQCGIPAFGIETSKSLPLKLKIHHHNLAINAFMNYFGIIAETPAIKLATPELEYLVVMVNDLLPVALKNNETLHINRGDSIFISHISANYKRGLTVDILGYGARNDMRRDIQIKEPTEIVVRKDYSPCGVIYIDFANLPGQKAKGIFVLKSSDKKPLPRLDFTFKVNGKKRVLDGTKSLDVIRGDKIEIVSVTGKGVQPSSLLVNFKGFVGNKQNNTGEDRGYVIDTGKDLWKRYSKDKAGKVYLIVVTHHQHAIETVSVNIK